MRNIIGFLIGIGIGALAIFGYGHYNAKADKAAETTVVESAEVAQTTETEVEQAKVEVAKVEEVKVATEKKVVSKPVAPIEKKSEEKPQVEIPKPIEKSAKTATNTVDFDKKMQEYGLVDISTLNKEIRVELKYATTDNFVGKNMYGDLTRAYLNHAFAKKVLKAQDILKKRNPNYTLLIYDAARPISVQRTMKKIVEGGPFDDFVADGKRGGRHNYGVAVDLTIYDKRSKKALDMGTGFDSFDEASSVKSTPDNSDPATRTIDIYRTFVRGLQNKGLISKQAANNRILLLEVMHEAGLYPYRKEWWHFELIESMPYIRSNYPLLDF